MFVVLYDVVYAVVFDYAMVYAVVCGFGELSLVYSVDYSSSVECSPPVRVIAYWG